MKEFTVCFLSWHYNSPQHFLDTLTKLTPGLSNKWKNMKAVLDPEKADFIAVFDGYNNTKLPMDRVLLFGQHPYIENGHCPAFRDWKNETCLGKYPLTTHWNAGEPWIPHTYDELSSLKYSDMDKQKDLCCVMTYQTHIPMYEQRVKFMEKFVTVKQDFDLYGRPSEKFEANPAFNKVYKGQLGPKNFDAGKAEHFLGKDVVGNYKYSIEIDVGPTKNYISERFYDALLLWTKPIYFGSNNVHEILPDKSFDYIDIYDLSFTNFRKTDIIEREDIEAMAHARDLLLNKYQTWAMVYERIKEL